MNLRTKLSLLISLLIVCIIIGFSIVLFMAEKNFLVEEAYAKRTHMINSFSEVAKEYFITKEEIPLISYIKEIKNVPEIIYAMTADTNGKILAHTDMDKLWAQMDDKTGKKALAHTGIKEYYYTDKNHQEIFDLASDVRISNKKNGIVRIGFSAEYIEESINHLLAGMGKRILFVGFIALIMGIAASFLLALQITKPIQRLVESSIQIGKGNLDEHVEVTSSDELGTLANRFNEMTCQLKELDQMKQDFVSSVTHELRSPLTSLSMYIGLFFQEAAGPLNEKSKEFLDIMEKNVARLKRFIDSLLDIAKLERGKMDIRKTTVDTGILANEISSLFKPHADQDNIAFSTVLPPKPPSILADPDKTIQILTNLLSNAFKFTKPNGKICLKISAQNHSVLFAVSDTGVGIPPDKIDKIFNKFEQVQEVNNQFDGAVKGTGLGLAIVKNLVDLQGGKIWVKSKINKGTTFFFTLPSTDS